MKRIAIPIDKGLWDHIPDCCFLAAFGVVCTIEINKSFCLQGYQCISEKKVQFHIKTGIGISKPL